MVTTTLVAKESLRDTGPCLGGHPLFPGTDHGRCEFSADADGTHRETHIADGHPKLRGDGIEGCASGTNVRAR